MNTDTALPVATRIIAGFESFRSHVYQDQGGVWTQGYGCTYWPNGCRVMPTDTPISEPSAWAWLQIMVGRVLIQVRMMVEVQITDEQAVCLTSFAYNLGTGALRNSTLLKLLNQGEYVEAGKQFGAWVHVKGVIEPGLVKRRAAEAAPFLSAGPALVWATQQPAESDSDRLNDAELRRIRS